jgi:hypothetical protein
LLYSYRREFFRSGETYIREAEKNDKTDLKIYLQPMLEMQKILINAIRKLHWLMPEGSDPS